MTVRTSSLNTPKRLIESVALGLGYSSVLVWIGSALVGSFGTDYATPYWPAVPRLRTDTAGVLAFAVAAVCLSVSRYLQLNRGRGRAAVRLSGRNARSAGVLALQAVAETAMVLCTGIVIYLSVNAVTHPSTLKLQLTHLLPWPSEGTVRVIALGVCLVATAVSRFLRSADDGQLTRQPAAGWEKTDLAAEQPSLTYGPLAGRSIRAEQPGRSPWPPGA
jgi:hypothetical protein